jgi:hypothetical protein
MLRPSTSEASASATSSPHTSEETLIPNLIPPMATFEDGPIEAAAPDDLGDDGFDATSDFGSLASSGFTSLDTRVREHVYEGGR